MLPQWLSKCRWPYGVLLLVSLAGLALCVKLLSSGGGGATVPLALGGALAWTAGRAALLLAICGGVELLLRRQSSLMDSRIAPLTMALGGAGLLLAALPLLLGASNQRTISAVLAGAVMMVLGLFRMRQPYRSVSYPFLHLALVILMITGAQEAGTLDVKWSHTSTQVKAEAWTSSGRCYETPATSQPSISGAAIGQATSRPTSQPKGRFAAQPSLRAIKPPLVFDGRRLSGSVGYASQRLLGVVQGGVPRGVAVVSVSGHFDGGELDCYLPLFRRLRVKAPLKLQVSWKAPDGGRLCAATYQSQFELDANSSGIGSCRRLKLSMAMQLAQSIRAETRQLLGR